MLWERADGALMYADANHRLNAPVALVLDSCQLLVTPAWLRNTDGLANRLAITYGDPPDVVTAEDPASQAAYGFHDYSATTEIRRRVEVVALASLTMARNTAPVWTLETLPLATADLSVALTSTVLGLEVHSLIHVTDLPAAGPAPLDAFLWVEGWTETHRFGEWDLELNVSDFARTAPPPQWDDVDPVLIWDDVDPALTWDEMLAVPPAVAELEVAANGRGNA
jgi:hypothetical protein